MVDATDIRLRKKILSPFEFKTILTTPSSKHTPTHSDKPFTEVKPQDIKNLTESIYDEAIENVKKSYKELIKEDPENKEFYQKEMEKLIEELKLQKQKYLE
jgi:hypothetical protein